VGDEFEVTEEAASLTREDQRRLRREIGFDAREVCVVGPRHVLGGVARSPRARTPVVRGLLHPSIVEVL